MCEPRFGMTIQGRIRNLGFTPVVHHEQDGKDDGNEKGNTEADGFAPPQDPVVQYQKGKDHDGHDPERTLHGQGQHRAAQTDVQDRGQGRKDDGEGRAHAGADGPQRIGQGHHHGDE